MITKMLNGERREMLVVLTLSSLLALASVASAQTVSRLPVQSAGNFGRPRYDVRTTYQTREGGEIVTRSYVDRDVDIESVSVGELRAQSYNDAADAAASYTGGLVGVSSITIEQV